MRQSQVPKLNRWLIEQDARDARRNGKKVWFESLLAKPRGPMSQEGNLVYVEIPGEPFGLAQPVQLDIPRCAQVYAGPVYPHLKDKTEPVQLLAAGFSDNSLSPVYFSLLRAQAIQKEKAALILLPWVDNTTSSVIYAGLLRNPRYMQKPSYAPDWRPFALGLYPVRTQEVKDLEKRLAT